MAFWSSEKLKSESSTGKLVDPFDETAIKYGAYELRLGPEAFLTSYADGRKKSLGESEQVVIPPGQFGLLLTEEKIIVPPSAIGFISIKAGIKFRGLVNVSGFHVDPGFSGRLKFSVYNAGSRDIVIERKQRVFLIWFSDLDQPTQPYSGEHAGQNEITPDDVMKIQGEIASPGQLKNDIRDLRKTLETEVQELKHDIAVKAQTLDHRIDSVNWKLTALLSIATGVLAWSLRGCMSSVPDQTHHLLDARPSLLVTNPPGQQPAGPQK